MVDDDSEEPERGPDDDIAAAERTSEAPPEHPGGELSPKVRRALARARAAVREDGARREGRWLAVIPVGVALIMGLLMLPRATVPTEVPLPDVDQRSIDAVLRADTDRARAARESRLETDVLAVGSHIRALNAALHAADTEQADRIRIELDHSIQQIPPRELVPSMLALRAIQLDEFVGALARFEETGEESKDLVELSGPFVRRLRDTRWIEEHRLVLDAFERRVVFKIAWNTVAGLEKLDALQPTLDELRVLYRLYLSHPHPTELSRLGLSYERRTARTPADCERYEQNARRAIEAWRLQKIRSLGAIDPTYPTEYSLGVSYYLQGNYDAAIDSFRAWIDAHPDGKWSVRARNHLKAALAGYGAI